MVTPLSVIREVPDPNTAGARIIFTEDLRGFSHFLQASPGTVRATRFQFRHSFDTMWSELLTALLRCEQRNSVCSGEVTSKEILEY
jgi:hypothetical protein